jgi:hypothetical protein
MDSAVNRSGRVYQDYGTLHHDSWTCKFLDQVYTAPKLP